MPCYSAYLRKILLKSDIWLTIYGQKMIFNMAAIRHLEFKKYSYFDTWMSSSSIFAVVYQTLSKLETHSASRLPQLLNVQCAVARQRPLPWQPHRGEQVGDTIVSLGYNCCMSVWVNFTGDTKNCVTKSIFNRQQLNKYQ